MSLNVLFEINGMNEILAERKFPASVKHVMSDEFDILASVWYVQSMHITLKRNKPLYANHLAKCT